MPARTTPDDLRRILQQTRTVAVLGAHPQRHRAAFYVPEYLHSVGYRIYPVNPMKLGETLWGQPVRAALTELPEPIDMVDVFRRSTALAGHLDEILAMAPLPRVVWLQLGIRDDDFTQQLMDAGIEVVEDRCTLAEHRRLF
ncbi:MAG: putative CoA-binding protein [Myxococcota bacterium]